MISEFEKWRLTTPFADEAFFESYVKSLQDLELSNKKLEYIPYHRFRDIQTVPLMSRLNHTCDNKDLYLDALILDIGCINIVVMDGRPSEFGDFSRNSVSWTMTELKQSKSSRLFYIDKECSVRKINWDDHTWLKVWCSPLHLRAVTYGNKGFKTKHGDGYFSYWGTQAGDTSDFYIVGSLTQKKIEL